LRGEDFLAEVFLMGIKSWRDVIEPHPDVASGRYKQAEFAADLGQVVRGEGNIEYGDALEFFSRTYLTDGLKILLVETLKRLSDGSGNPVIQLKTSFGGGKTHSLLALYHLFGGKIRAEQSSVIREVLNAAEISFLPKVHTAVIVGTWENPLRTTLWGEIAMQLARSTGKPELYELIRENDEKRISPGIELLKKLFDEAGACLILIDELVAYGRKLDEGKIESGGTFENLLSFIQELTEAAKAAKKSAVIVSIPESDDEIGGELGRKVLKKIEKHVGRVEFVWTPIKPQEGYEIVRRRLFKPCRDDSAREKVCAAFFSMYVNNANDFPYESRQNTCREKLLACYPIHPKIFDYLYNKWTSLEGFQKTRGVLRLMASVIYYLWTNNDTSALIMPGNIPINFSPVRDELIKLLGGNWDAIINAEVDGEDSKPQELDSQNSRFGRLTAARKIARTIFMGTAPSGNRKGDVRGIPENEIRFGVVQPQEVESIAVYNDALTNLKTNLYYLYSLDGRFWFSVNPTLRKLVEDKREQISDDDIVYEIEARLKNWKKDGKFKAVNTCPKSSEDIPDEQKSRLIILSPKYTGAEAIEQGRGILEFHGKIPRKWKNMLLFMAADAEKLRVLKDIVRDYLAWTAVNKDKLNLNLDALQQEDAESNLKLAKENFAMKLSQAYCQIFAPETSEDNKLNFPTLYVAKIDCTKEDNISVASEKFIREEKLLESLGCEALRQSLNKYLWKDKDALDLNKLWEYFASLYYLPRLVEENVLINAVRKGVASKTFAVAEKFEDGKYINLKFGDVACDKIYPEYLLVKAEVAQEQLNIKDEPAIEIEDTDKNTDNDIAIDFDDYTPPLPKHFSMDVELDNVRYVKELKEYVDEIASLLMNLPNSKTSIHVAINISVPEGISQDLIDVIKENFNTLKISEEHFRFEP